MTSITKLFINIVLKQPKTFFLTNTQLEQIIFPENDYRIIDLFGSGNYGIVLAIENKKNKKIYALKLGKVEENEQKEALNEFFIQQEFAKYQMAPAIHSYEIQTITINKKNIFWIKAIMDPIRTTVSNFIMSRKDSRLLIEPFECLIKKKYLLKYPNPFLHTDMHLENIAILNDGKTLGFIDFGFTQQFPAIYQILDSITIISDLKRMVKKYIRVNQLIEALISFYDKMFTINLEYNKFSSYEHGGFIYGVIQDKNFIHSYPFVDKKLFGPFPSVERIKEFFPTITLPTIQ